MACVSNWQIFSGSTLKRLFYPRQAKRTIVRSKTQDVYDKKSSQLDDLIERKVSRRLRSLLSSVQYFFFPPFYLFEYEIRDTEDDVYSQFLQDVPTEYKMSVFLQLSSLLVFTSLGVCIVCGVDPFGGMNILRPDIRNGLLGFMAAIPPIIIHGLLAKPASFPAGEDYRDRKNGQMGLLFANLSFQDSMIVVGLVTLSFTFVTFSGIVGCFSSSANAYSQLLGPGSSRSNDGLFEAVLCLVAIALAYVNANGYCMTAEEAEVVKNAASNSERYYRLTKSADEPADAPQLLSQAFQRVAWNYMQTNKQACILAAALVFGETVYAGMIWKATGDLSTTLCFIFAICSADYLFFRSSLAAQRN